MKILAIDIGSKTQDIMLYDDSITIENCIKMVLPAPSLGFIKEILQSKEDLFIKGDTIGGGMLSKAIKEHAKKYRVFMTEPAAYTIRNDIDVVKSHGIEIVAAEDADNFEENFKGKVINLQEIDLKFLANLLMHFNEKLDIDYIGVAVQDHGAAPKGMSNRKSRFKLFADVLKKSRDIKSFAFKTPPKHFFRMTSVINAIKKQTDAKTVVMDTSPDAVIGCFEDEHVNSAGPTLIINMGNSHSIFMVVSGMKVDAIMEHHTRLLNDPEKLKNLVRRFADGEITGDEIYNDGGHGALILDSCGFENLKQIVITGPNRNLFKKTNLNVYYATPAGDAMMTGPIGLIRCIKKIYHL